MDDSVAGVRSCHNRSGYIDRDGGSSSRGHPHRRSDDEDHDELQTTQAPARPHNQHTRTVLNPPPIPRRPSDATERRAREMEFPGLAWPALNGATMPLRVGSQLYKGPGAPARCTRRFGYAPMAVIARATRAGGQGAGAFCATRGAGHESREERPRTPARPRRVAAGERAHGWPQAWLVPQVCAAVQPQSASGARARGGRALAAPNATSRPTSCCCCPRTRV